MAATKLSAKEAAQQIGTDPRTLRKFIRSAKDLPIEPVGQGNRYEFTSQQVKALKKSFIAWSNGSKKPSSNGAKKIEDMTTEEKDEYASYLAEVEEGIPHTKPKRSRSKKAPVPDLTFEKDEVEEIELEDLEGPSDEDLEELDIEVEDLD